MSNLILNPEGFGLKIYNHFPPSYREDDVQTNYSLKRYLDACGEGGFKLAIEEWNGILELANPDQATPQALPILYQQFGLDLFNGIPEQFVRYFLPKLGEAWSKKGSLDVVEFVVSSLSGILTNTKVVYDDEGNVDLIIRLQMDNAISTYFPEYRQFSRLIDKFLPFYLGKKLIYAYVFYLEQKIHVDEDPLDRVKYFTDEPGFIASSGFLPKGTTNNLLKRLNDNLITNEWEQYAPIPDVLLDHFHTYYREQTRFDPRWSREFFYSVWNQEKTNATLYTNRYLETDGCRDRIILPLHEVSFIDTEDHRKDHITISKAESSSFSSIDTEDDTIRVSYNDCSSFNSETTKDNHKDTVVITQEEQSELISEDRRKDRLIIGKRPLFRPATNTGFETNTTFYTNDTDIDRGVIIPKDNEDFTIKTAFNERAEFGSVVSFTVPKKTTNNKKQVTNNSLKTNDLYEDTDKQEDRVTYTINETTSFSGEDSYLANSLNMDTTEDAYMSSEDSDILKSQSRLEESAVFMAPTSYLFTNFLSLGTNQCLVGVPDAFDVVTCKDGTKFGIFSP